MLDRLICDLESGEADIRFADLSSITPKPKVAEAIEALKANGIKELKLSNDLDLSDVLALSQALATNTSLETLDLSGNNFCSNSCLALGRALEHNGTLRTLDLSNNKKIIGTLAIEQFLIGAQKNTGLRKLCLQGMGPCSSSCIQKVIELMPRLHTLYSNIFGPVFGCQVDPKEVMYLAAQNGLFKALQNHYSLCSMDFGNYCVGFGFSVTQAVARRNTRIPYTIYRYSAIILGIGIHEKGMSKTTLQAVYDLSTQVLSIRDSILYYKGSAHAVTTELHEERMNSSDANKLLREVSDLALCIYARDVVCKDTPEADKFHRFCSVMAVHKREKTTGVRVTNLERAANEYYRSANDPFAAEIDKAITETNASLDFWNRQMVEHTRAAQAARASRGNYYNTAF